MFKVDQRVTVSVNLIDDSVLTEHALVLHVEDDLAVLAPAREWTSIWQREALSDQISAVQVLWGVDKGALTVSTNVKRWPTRPRAHLTLLGFGEPKSFTRRRFPRIDAQLPAQIAVADGTKFVRQNAVTCNLSAGGALLVTPNPVEDSAVVVLLLDISSAILVMVGAVVECSSAPSDDNNVISGAKLLQTKLDAKLYYVRMTFVQVSMEDAAHLDKWLNGIRLKAGVVK